LVGTVVSGAGVLCLTVGCSSTAYLWQAASGHLALMNSARPVDDWLADPQLAPPLREKLELSQRLRDFAISELKLPDNRSYRAYADLGRPAAVWNVVATPELSLTLQTWCFPVVGCVGYRGFYSLAKAQAAALELRQSSAPKVLDVAVYPVPAYSTLGWGNALGGDPLLNTFINSSEGELARLVFHELSHQQVYVAGDTAFNEAFATSVERLGAERWLLQHGSPRVREASEKADARRQDVRELLGRYRDAMNALFSSSASEEEKRAGKARLMQALREEQALIKANRWGGYAGYDAYFRSANNATLAVQAAYDGLVPAFMALFENEARDFERFYRAVKALAALPKSDRDARLQLLLRQGSVSP
jgi:predicted aminopeptidase